MRVGDQGGVVTALTDLVHFYYWGGKGAGAGENVGTDQGRDFVDP